METSTGSIFCTTEAHSEEGSSLNEYCIDMLELNHLNPALLWNVWSCPLHHQLFLFTSSDLLSPHMQANLCKSLVFVQLLTSQTVELFRLNITHGSSLILFTSAIWMLACPGTKREEQARKARSWREQAACYKRSTDGRDCLFQWQCPKYLFKLPVEFHSYLLVSTQGWAGMTASSKPFWNTSLKSFNISAEKLRTK